MTQCIKCGAPLKDGSAFCPCCGAKQNAARQPEDRPQPPQKAAEDKQPVRQPSARTDAKKTGGGKKTGAVIAAAVLALLIVAGGIFAVYRFSQRHKPDESAAGARRLLRAAEDASNLSGEEAAPDEGTSKEIRLVTHTVMNDSGLIGYLLPVFEEKTGYHVTVCSFSIGVAVEYAKSGEADLLLLPKGAQTESLLCSERYVSSADLLFLYNYNVIVGPAEDPAGVRSLESAADCFKAIARAGAGFDSCGNNSLLHTKEALLWETAGTDPEGESWYRSLGAGMGDTLTDANENKAYALADKATFLSMKDSLPNLAILKDETEDLKNMYSLFTISSTLKSASGSGVNEAGADALAAWLKSDEAAGLIKQYGVAQFGEPLFFRSY